MAEPSVRLQRRQGYQFDISFGDDLPVLLVDETPPLGQGVGPTPGQLLVAAVANCLCASLTFALTKFKNEPGALSAQAKGTIGRNEAGRLRFERIEVDITLPQPAAAYQHLDRILAQFEEFCTVSMSVKQGFPVEVRVRDAGGALLKG